MADGSIVIDTKIDQKGLGKELQSFGNNLKKGITIAAKGAAVAMGLLAAGFLAVSKAAKEFSAITDRVDKLSQRIGISRQAFQEWDFILSQTGAEVEGLEMGVRTLSKAADEASQGVATYADNFDRLGISVTDTNGNLKDSETLFNETFTALSQVESQTERTALASELLGRSATALAPAFNQGADAIEAMRQEAHDLGLIMSDDVIDAGVILTDNLDKLRRSGRGLFVEVFSGIVPALNTATDALIQWISGKGGVSGIISSIKEWFISLGVGVKKAWVSMTEALSVTFFKYVAGLKMNLASMKMAFLVAINGIKIGFLTLVQVISEKVLGKVQELLEVLAKIPFVGEKFQEAANFVGGLNENLDQSIQAAKDASAAEIQAAIAAREEYKAQVEGEVLAREQAARDKIAAIDTEHAAGVAQREAERQAEQDRLVAAARENRIQEARRTQLEELLGAQGKYNQAIAETQAKAESGYITEREQIEANISAAQSYIDELFSMGVTMESAAEDGGEALLTMLDVLSESKAQLEAFDAGKDLSRNVGKGMEKGIEDSEVGFIDSVKGLFTVMSGAVENGIRFLGFGKRIDRTMKEGEDEAEESGGQMAQIMTDVFNGMVNAVRAGIRLVAGAINWAATFDPVALIESLQTFSDGIKNFFEVDIFNITSFFTVGVDIIKDLISGIESNIENIKEAIGNTVKAMATKIVEDGPQIITEFVNILFGIIDALTANAGELIQAGLDMLLTLVGGIIANLPMLLTAALDIIMSLATYITENASEMVSMVIDLLLTIVMFIVENLDLLIAAAIEITVALAVGIAENIDVIVEAVISAIPLIIMALIGAIPKLIAAIVRIGIALATGLFRGIVQGFKSGWQAIVDLFMGIITFFKNLFGIHSPSKVFSGLGKSLIQGLVNGITGMASAVWDAITGLFSGIAEWVANFFKGIWDGITGGVMGGLDAAGNLIGDIGEGIGNVVDATGKAVVDIGSAIGSGVSDVGKNIGNFFGFASGTPNIPRNMIAQVHQGERIVPKTFNQDLMAGNTMMLAPEALAQIVSGMTGATQQISLSVNVIPAPISIDGREIARVSYQHLDELAAGL